MVKISHSTLLKISLITTIFSLLVISAIETKIPPEKISIDNLTIFDINKPFLINATISKQTLLKQGHLIMTLKQNNKSLQAIMFSINTTIKNKKNILATGRIKTYNGKLQLIIEKIK